MRRAIAIALLCLPAAAAAARQAPAAARQTAEVRVPFRAGEALTYDVSWSRYLTAGTATLSVVDRHPSYGSVAYYVVGEARPSALLSSLYTLYYKADALIDVYTLLPQRASVYSEEGRRRLNKVTRFDEQRKILLFESRTVKDSRREIPAPAYCQDALSAVYVLRALPLKAGGRTEMPIASGGRTYRAAISTNGMEAIETPAGVFQAWRLRADLFDDRGRPVGRPLQLWLSDTPSRVPVKFQADLAVGSFNLTLRDVKPGGAR